MLGKRVCLVVLFWGLVGSPCASTASLRLFSQASISVQAKVNGVPGQLTIAHFRCPGVVHLAACGLSFVIGEPLLLSTLAHLGIRLAENFTWAEFAATEGEPQCRQMSATVRTNNDDICRLVPLWIESDQRLAEKHAGKALALRGGKMELRFSQLHQKVTERRSFGGRSASYYIATDWVHVSVIDLIRSELVFEETESYQHYQVTHGERDTRVQQISPACADLLTWAAS